MYIFNTRMYTIVSKCIYIFIFIFIYTYMHTYLHTYIPTYIHTFIHIYIYMCVCVRRLHAMHSGVSSASIMSWIKCILYHIIDDVPSKTKPGNGKSWKPPVCVCACVHAIFGVDCPVYFLPPKMHCAIYSAQFSVCVWATWLCIWLHWVWRWQLHRQ